MNAIVDAHAAIPPGGLDRFLRERLRANLRGFDHGRLSLCDGQGTLEFGNPGAAPADPDVRVDVLDPSFILSNGDSFFDFNFRALTAAPLEGLARLALRRVDDVSRYGSVALADGCVTAFIEKNPANNGPGLINGGVYFLRRDIVDRLSAPCSLEVDVFPKLVAEGLVEGQMFDGYFLDIGLPETLAQAKSETAARRVKPTVVFDRDGVLNIDSGYTHRPEDLVWQPGAREAIRLLNDRGYYVIVATNQAGVAHGIHSEETVAELAAYLAERGTPRTRRDLAHHRCLLGFARGELPQTHWPLAGGGELRVEGAFLSNDIALLADAAVRGLGIAVLPRQLVDRHLAAGALVQVLPGVIQGESRVSIVYPERELMPPQVRAFVEAVLAWAPGALGNAEARGMSEVARGASPATIPRSFRPPAQARHRKSGWSR